MRKVPLGRISGFDITFDHRAIVGSAALWVALSFLAATLLDLRPLEAIIGGLLAVLLHWFGEIIHQLGHTRAAKQTGYPMSGIRLGAMGILATSLYPRDEPKLPGRVHIRRALGGPTASILLTVVAAVIAFLLRDAGDFWRGLSQFFVLENGLVFTLGAFMPLGFTDGSTILTWWPKR